MCLYDLNNLKSVDVSDSYLRQVAVGMNISVARIQIRKGSTTQLHSHVSEEIVIVLKGKWRFTLPTHEVIVSPNQMLLIPSQLEHSSVALEDTIAIDICTPARGDWISGEDGSLHNDPDQYLWAV